MTRRAKPSRVEKADIAVARKAGSVRHRPVMKLAADISDVADQPPLRAIGAATMVVGALARSERMALAGVRMLAAHQLATSVKNVIKHSIDRTRPERVLDGKKYVSGEARHDSSPWSSFPSGHTAGAVAVARAIGRDYPSAAIPALTLAVAAGAIQVPRGKHYVSDVIAGAVIGLAAEYVINRLAKKVGIS
jgi:membrane-associated phospholipid phosphatase